MCRARARHCQALNRCPGGSAGEGGLQPAMQDPGLQHGTMGFSGPQGNPPGRSPDQGLDVHSTVLRPETPGERPGLSALTSPCLRLNASVCGHACNLGLAQGKLQTKGPCLELCYKDQPRGLTQNLQAASLGALWGQCRSHGLFIGGTLSYHRK